MADIPVSAFTDLDPTVNQQYVGLCELVIKFGRHQVSRLGPTRELLDTRFVCTLGDIPKRTNMNLMIGWSEMFQFIGGVYTPEVLERVAPKANLALFTKNMAYGLRTSGQMTLLLDELRRAPGTRRAVLYIGNAGDQIDDAPCTNTIQFIIRDDKLNMIVSMRSWDLIKGLPYDVMMFGGFGLCVADCVHVRPGVLSINAGSAHIYEQDVWMLPKNPSLHWRFRFDDKAPTTWWPNVERWARLNNDQLMPGHRPRNIELIKN